MPHGWTCCASIICRIHSTRWCSSSAVWSSTRTCPACCRAFAQVVKQRPRTRLLLAGSGPLHDALAAQIGQLGLQDHALLLGEQSEVPALMEAADLVVLPSLREGLSNVVLEAMALGRAVLSTPVGGIPQAIDNGRHGVLVEPTDTDALARACSP